MIKRGKYSTPDSAWCEICDGHHGPGQHPEAGNGSGNVSDKRQRAPYLKHYETVMAALRGPRVKAGHLFDVLEAIESAGLTLVPAADVSTTEERAVLEAVASIPAQELRSSGNWYGWAKPIGEAERARRAAKEAKGAR